MFARAAQAPTRPMLRHHAGGAWHSTTWGSFARQAASLARHLRAQGVAAGDRVLIVAENRPEYPIAETALLAIRAVPVPAYTTYTVEDYAHVLRDCGARAAIVSTPDLASRVTAAYAASTHPQAVEPLALLVMMDFAAPGYSHPDTKTLAFVDLTADDLPPDDIAAEAALIPPDSLACLIYTSGTGGAPKGVMLPHRAILSNCRGAYKLIQMIGLQDDVYLSYLPLSHSYEHTAGQFFMLSLGAEVAYSRGVEHLAADFLAVRPTIITMVPRVLEVIRGRILQGVQRGPAWKQFLFNQAVTLGTRRLDGHRLPPHLALLDKLLDKLVRSKIADRFGGRVRVAISGGARLEPDVGKFYLALGLRLLQGYGQTEAGPVISANLPTAIRAETVGPPLEGVDLRIAEDGEILVRGDLVMAGYWGRPEETAAAIRDGWLHTGDIGVIDPDGYLRITDRKKDIIVLAGGDNISPARVEGMLVNQPAIAQAVVFGDGRATLSALIVPAEGYDPPAIAHAVDAVNKRLTTTERIRRHATVPPFTIDNGQLTATQKVKRHIVRQTHAATLEKLGA
ncbi:MAG: long-chain fatty acid--CoA ligase [Acetobacteraceae bacterium]|nr:long-chain fatty acid--CoA ligase [Acetobacteraceae bacterium]